MNDPLDCYYFVETLGEICKNEHDIEKETIDNFIEDKNRYARPYLLCFSRLSNDLHMWTCYGDNGKGLALGFNDLESCVEESTQRTGIPISLSKCLYQSTKQIKDSLELANILKPMQINADFWKNNTIADISNKVKHPCYKYEKEYRVVATRNQLEPLNSDAYIKDGDFFEFKVPLKNLSRIIVGPNANYEAIKQIFGAYFPKVKIIDSRLPYRS